MICKILPSSVNIELLVPYAGFKLEQTSSAKYSLRVGGGFFCSCKTIIFATSRAATSFDTVIWPPKINLTVWAYQGRQNGPGKILRLKSYDSNAVLATNKETKRDAWYG